MKHTPKLHIDSILIIIFAIFYIFGVFFHSQQYYSEAMMMLTSWVLVITSFTIILQTISSRQRSLEEKKWIIIWFCCTYIVTYLLELVGVHTGIIFGDYHYGTTLGFALFDVPLVIGLNWCIIIFAITDLLRILHFNLPIRIFLTAFIAVLFDFVLEPVASGTIGYWFWENNIIPSTNYLHWFIIAGCFSVLFYWMVPDYSAHATQKEPSGNPHTFSRFQILSTKFFPILVVGIQFIFILALNMLRNL